MLLKSLLIGLGSVVAMSVNAGTTVKQLDADRLMVIDTSGKPPFHRQIVQRSTNPEVFAAWAPRALGDVAMMVTEVQSRGVPGKSMASSRARISFEPVESVEFARFEETQEALAPNRRWRGAPGKGVPLNQ